MPMVPMFQGGVPQTLAQGGGSSGINPKMQDVAPIRQGSGSQASTLSMPRNLDYENLLKRSMAPVQEFAGSLAKTLEIMRVRTIKAESDDAERRVMDIIDATMNDPESGYMSKFGKNAMDAYDDAMSGMKKGIDNVLNDISPQAREAVASRIIDRQRTAVNQASRWNAQQTRSYQVNSSQARINALVSDASNHYSDLNYLNKTTASVMSEIDYLANLQGMDADSVKNLKSAYRDSIQAGRFSAWSEDDPVAALAAFQSLPDGSIGADVKDKLGRNLWGNAKKILAINIADTLGTTILDKKDFLKESLKPGFQTGDPVVDRLNKQQKLELFTEAYAYSAQKCSQVQSELQISVKNSLAAAAVDGSDPNAPTEDMFVAAYGEKIGHEQYASFKRSFDTAATQYSYRFMSPENMMADVENARPSPGDPDYAERKQAAEIRLKVAQEINKERQNDPIGSAIAGQQFGIEPLNFDNASQMIEQLKTRVMIAPTVSAYWSVPQVLFSNQEAKALVAVLDRAPVSDRVEILSQIAGAVGESGVAMISRQLKDGDRKSAVAMAGMGMNNQSGISVGEKYLRGMDAIEQKRVKIDPKVESGIVATMNNLIGDDPQEDTAGVFTSPEAAKDMVELATGVYAFQALSGESNNPTDAMTSAVGGEVHSYRGKKIVLPKGVTDSSVFNPDISEAVATQSKFINKMKGVFYFGGVAMTAQELAAKLPKLSLQTRNVNDDGSVTYSLIYNGQPIYGPDGSLYLFDLSKDMLLERKRKYEEETYDAENPYGYGEDEN